MPLLRSGRFVRDEWRALGADEGMPQSGRIVVPLGRLIVAEAQQLNHRSPP